MVCGEISPHNFTVDWVSRTVVQARTPEQQQKFAFRPALPTVAANHPVVASSSEKPADGVSALTGALHSLALDPPAETKTATAGPVSGGGPETKAEAGGKYVHLAATTAEERKTASLTTPQVLQLVSEASPSIATHPSPQLEQYMYTYKYSRRRLITRTQPTCHTRLVTCSFRCNSKHAFLRLCRPSLGLLWRATTSTHKILNGHWSKMVLDPYALAIRGSCIVPTACTSLLFTPDYTVWSWVCRHVLSFANAPHHHVYGDRARGQLVICRLGGFVWSLRRKSWVFGPLCLSDVLEQFSRICFFVSFS